MRNTEIDQGCVFLSGTTSCYDFAIASALRSTLAKHPAGISREYVTCNFHVFRCARRDGGGGVYLRITSLINIQLIKRRYVFLDEKKKKRVSLTWRGTKSRTLRAERTLYDHPEKSLLNRPSNCGLTSRLGPRLLAHCPEPRRPLRGMIDDPASRRRDAGAFKFHGKTMIFRPSNGIFLFRRIRETYLTFLVTNRSLSLPEISRTLIGFERAEYFFVLLRATREDVFRLTFLRPSTDSWRVSILINSCARNLARRTAR